MRIDESWKFLLVPLVLESWKLKVESWHGPGTNGYGITRAEPSDMKEFQMNSEKVEIWHDIIISST